jgi:hypothetical protein
MYNHPQSESTPRRLTLTKVVSKLLEPLDKQLKFRYSEKATFKNSSTLQSNFKREVVYFFKLCGLLKISAL